MSMMVIKDVCMGCTLRKGDNLVVSPATTAYHIEHETPKARLFVYVAYDPKTMTPTSECYIVVNPFEWDLEALKTCTRITDLPVDERDKFLGKIKSTLTLEVSRND